MSGELAIHHLGGGLGLGPNAFGRDVANLALYRAFAQHGGYERLHMLTSTPTDPGGMAEALAGDLPLTTAIETGALLDLGRARRAGTLFRGKADLAEMAWARRGLMNDSAFSLVGLIHTIAPPLTREEIAQASLAPVHPWDAIICTSPSVHASIKTMFEGWTDYLGERFGGPRRPMPHLPILPLGVDMGAIAALADRPDVRRQTRARLGLAEEDVMALWVGRLSFFEKAAPQPMFRAVEEAGRLAGRPLHFALAGWFARESDRAHFEAAARAYAPSATIHWIDGNDADQLGQMWAASDIFLSLVDNIQETFGLAPVEAMAAGLPVVASDWDGYRFTIRHGQDGFLVPTLIPGAGPPSEALLRRHLARIDTYQSYVGQAAQYTAVDVGAAARALAELAGSPELRARMGAAGRQRVRETFDWRQVIPTYRALFDELAEIRRAAPPSDARPRLNPLHGDPFADHRSFATAAAGADLRLSVRPGIDLSRDPALTRAVELDSFGEAWRAPRPELAQLAAHIAEHPDARLGDLVAAIPPERRSRVTYGLLWLCKMGVLDWRQG
ncbi:glycosyltransferase family 4 protein [Phenylobacterium sp.]|uniref:glycosyltransferase family 4 protein n=1 Tax=Phenylobacterium sp. TaxID=1871053 RepID=UPI0027317094|nr:glycosyltransferase family 4 protein [Phenylobacterium sp.]MDP1616127.1 glycosyltransferase family 4 protein [Phenylobacterium sp.]MDP1988434.1 glycosyltransferase family 4 protein [Phenylobacterium sp.]